MYDGSLGKGYSVVVTAILDRLRGTFGVSCGAHPSLAIAVERTLTEAFQARDIHDSTSINDVAPVSLAAGARNCMKVYAGGDGVWPASLFVGCPSWEFEAWPEDKSMTNAELLAGMVALLKRDGYSLLVRNASFLGFPACHILVPGMSECCGRGSGACAADEGRRVFREAINTFPDVTREQEDVILAHEVAYADTPELIDFGRPFKGGTMHAARLFGMLHLAREEFGEAKECFLVLERAVGLLASLYWQAMARYVGWRAEGLGYGEAIGLVETLYASSQCRLSSRSAADTVCGAALSTLRYTPVNRGAYDAHPAS